MAASLTLARPTLRCISRVALFRVILRAVLRPRTRFSAPTVGTSYWRDSPLYTSIKVPALSPRHCVDLGFSAFALAVMDPLQFPRNLVGSASSATTSSTGVARRTTHNNRVCTHAQLLPTMVYPSPQPGFLSSTIAGTRNSANGRVTRQRHLAQKTAVKWRRWNT